MKKSTVNILIAVSLVFLLAVMTAIFCFSAQKATGSDKTSGRFKGIVIKIFYPDFASFSLEEQEKIKGYANHIVRKLAHFTEFTVLGIAFSLHLCAVNCKKRIKYKFLLSFILGALYAVSDEIHQLFVAGRSCELKDMLLDSSGVLFGVVLVYLAAILFSKIRPKRL